MDASQIVDGGPQNDEKSDIEKAGMPDKRISVCGAQDPPKHQRQQEADERIPLLLETPAAIRFISAEPLLGPIDLMERWWKTVGGRLDWVIAGGESGPGARPCELDWLRSLRAQCDEADVSFFCKQLGSVLGRQLGAGSKGGDWDEWPADLRVREFPEALGVAA